MGLENSVTSITDLNALWPLATDPRHQGDDHLRLIKVALKSLLTNPQQISVPRFADAEMPGGQGVSGVGSHTLSLAHTPVTGSLLLVVEYTGTCTTLVSPANYTISGATVTLVQAIFDGAQHFYAWYRW